jgi:hypothetical protein
MTWCNECLSNHEGPCLDERKRLELRGVLDGLLGKKVHICPYCGVEEPFCPVLALSGSVQAPTSSGRRCPLRAGERLQAGVASLH